MHVSCMVSACCMPAHDHCLTQIYLEFSVLYMAVLHACRSVSSVIACCDVPIFIPFYQIQESWRTEQCSWTNFKKT